MCGVCLFRTSLQSITAAWSWRTQRMITSTQVWSLWKKPREGTYWLRQVSPRLLHYTYRTVWLPHVRLTLFFLLEISISKCIVRINCNYQPCANMFVCKTIIIVITIIMSSQNKNIIFKGFSFADGKCWWYFSLFIYCLFCVHRAPSETRVAISGSWFGSRTPKLSSCWTGWSRRARWVFRKRKHTLHSTVSVFIVCLQMCTSNLDVVQPF